MKKINKKGFSKTEFMILLAVLAILIAVGSKLALDSSKSYGSFKTLANNFANAVARYKDKAIITKDEYSLYETEKNGYIDELLSPFDKNVKCDKYESYVSLKDASKKTIVLVCGEYLVEAVQGEKYKVYEISSWSETKDETHNDGDLLYNYKQNGNLVLDDYVQPKTLIGIYSEKTGKYISNINDIKSGGTELVSKMLYREKKLVKEFK